jgi:hypothetical protein
MSNVLWVFRNPHLSMFPYRSPAWARHSAFLQKLLRRSFVGSYSGDIDDGSYTLHRFVLENLPLKFPEGHVHPTLAYNFYLDGGDAKADEQGVLRSTALAHELGFETFVVDAMWFPQSGAWFWDPKRFPHGSKPIADYLHSLDMKLGLWMAYTQGSSSRRSSCLERHQTPRLVHRAAQA